MKNGNKDSPFKNVKEKMWCFTYKQVVVECKQLHIFTEQMLRMCNFI